MKLYEQLIAENNKSTMMSRVWGYKYSHSDICFAKFLDSLSDRDKKFAYVVNFLSSAIITEREISLGMDVSSHDKHVMEKCFGYLEDLNMTDVRDVEPNDFYEL